MQLTPNQAAMQRLLALTGFSPDRLIRAIPSLQPLAPDQSSTTPRIHHQLIDTRIVDCPQCQLRRHGAYLDPRLRIHVMACLRHHYWLHVPGDVAEPLDFNRLPDVARAYRRFCQLVARHGATTATRTYQIAINYLVDEWRAGPRPVRWWHNHLIERWQERLDRAATRPPPGALAFPSWATLPEGVALADLFADPHWASMSVPHQDRRHRAFYERLITQLHLPTNSVDGIRLPLTTIRIFKPLPQDIQEQARWDRKINDPTWGDLSPDRTPIRVPFADLTNH